MPAAPTAPLYNALPYPGDGVVRTPVAKTLARALEHHLPSLAKRPALSILDVGCGTGETTLGIGRLFPQATITGVDINPPSLAKARELAARDGSAVEFRKADILADDPSVMCPAGPVDVAVSMGVLHHLADPAQGFRAVREVVKPDGAFFCFVYSRYGRWDDQVAKSLLDRTFDITDFQQRADAVRHLRLSRRQSIIAFAQNLKTRLRFGPPIEPVEMLRTYLKRNQLTHTSDTFSNPCEHLFSFVELEQIFAQTGWSLVALADGFGMPTTAEAHTRDPEVLAVLAAMDRPALYDYLAYMYRVWGFGFLLRPA